MYRTLYIVPAFSDVAGQCRIVARDNDRKVKSASDNYRNDPDAWREVGLMNSRGNLVCFDGPEQMRKELEDCVPLMAGLVFEFIIGE